jgi:alcohol dehydrogenase
VTVGLPNPSATLEINALSLVADGKTLMGSYMGSSIPSRDIPAISPCGAPGGCRWNVC